jgi:hypothetical protein
MLHLAAEHGAAGEFMDAVQRELLGEGVNVYTGRLPRERGHQGGGAGRAGQGPPDG